MIVFSWGFHGAYAIKDGLCFSVNGYIHQGEVEVKYDGGAIGDGGHDKILCMKYHADVITKLCKERYNYEGYRVCGLCQTGVPCESGIPGGKEENE